MDAPADVCCDDHGMDMTARTLELVGADGHRLQADAWGRDGDPPVLLWHGGGQTRHSWGRTAQILAADGWLALSIDLRGHGGSAWSEEGKYGLDSFKDDVVAVARSFDVLPALVGASLGGIACLAAVGESRVPLARALVLVDVAPRIEEAGKDRISQFMLSNVDEGFGDLEEVADAIAAYNPHRPRPKDLSGLRKNLRRRPDGRWAWHWDPRFLRPPFGVEGETRSSLVNADRLEEAARRLDLPTLLVRGKESDLLSEEGARRFVDLVAGASYVDVAGAGHMIAGDRNDVFNDAVTSFLDRSRAGL